MGRRFWIIDGNYGSTMELRMKRCDTVIFLDYPLDVCLGGIEARKGITRSDMPWVDTGETDDDFLEFIRQYNVKSRPKVMELLKRYSHKNIFVFTSRTMAEAFLIGLKK